MSASLASPSKPGWPMSANLASPTHFQKGLFWRVLEFAKNGKFPVSTQIWWIRWRVAIPYFKRLIHHHHWPAKTLVWRRLANQLEMLLQNSICRQKVPILKSDFSLVILKIFNPQIELFDFNGKINRCFVCSCKREHLNEPGNLFFEWKTELNFTAAKFKEDFFQRTLNFYFFHSPTPLWINAH